MKIIHVAAKTALLSLLNSDEQKKYYCAKVDGKIRELTYVIDKEGDYNIEFLDLTDLDATKIYSASMRYIIAMACKILYPKLEMRFFYNISRSMFCKVMNPKNVKVSPAFVDKINKKVQELIKMDLPLERIKVSKEEAIGWYKKQGFKDKIQVIKYRSENFVHLYKTKCSEIEYYDYIYSNYNHAYNFILLVMLSLSLLFFVLSNIFAFIYSITIQKAVIYIANKATLKIKECIMQFIDRFDDNEKSNQP